MTDPTDTYNPDAGAGAVAVDIAGIARRVPIHSGAIGVSVTERDALVAAHREREVAMRLLRAAIGKDPDIQWVDANEWTAFSASDGWSPLADVDPEAAALLARLAGEADR